MIGSQDLQEDLINKELQGLTEKQADAQYCDLSGEELEKRTREVMSGERTSVEKELMGEMFRRVRSPAIIGENSRAANAYLRSKVRRMENELKKLRKELKKINTDKDVETIMEVQEEENLEERISESKDEGNDSYAMQMSEMTKNIVEAVDITLRVFLERLVPLEHAVVQIRNEQRAMEKGVDKENRVKIINQEGLERTNRRGMKRYAEEPTVVFTEDTSKRRNKRTNEEEMERIVGYRGWNQFEDKEDHGFIHINKGKESNLNLRVIMSELRGKINPGTEFGIENIETFRNNNGGITLRISGEDVINKTNQLYGRIKDNVHKYKDELVVTIPKRRPYRILIRGGDY